ncbi:CHASE domain-containing protein [Alkalimarinus coralli]|uniref:CHASE domain-containing protein n=1 Tax=Alkalimarinus coralli TaxID=2935863 RepID=UPI00202B6536|nr:CHASE domain-containing protein [Alkalimarinus coralli]
MNLFAKNSDRLHWVYWLVIGLSLLLTFAAWYVSDTQIEQKIKQRFEFQSNQLLSLVSERMSRYEDALRAGAAVIHTNNGKIDADGWKRFADALDLEETYAGINGIGVIYHVEPEELDAFLENERRLRPDFKIHPPHSQEGFWPITYIEPVKYNAKAVGLDMAFEHNRYTAAKQARDTSRTQITGPIVLVQDEKKMPGFLQYVPFYDSLNISTPEQRRKHFVGHVYAPFIVDKLIKGTLEQNSRKLIFSVYDGDDQLYNELLPGNADYDPSPLYSKEVSVDMYGRTWIFTIQTTQSFRKEISTNQSVYILVGGIVDSLLLFLLFVFVGSNRKSLLLAEKMTKKSLISEEYFRHIIEAAPCGMVIANEQGIIEQANPHAGLLFGYKKDELVGKTIESLVPKRFQVEHPKNREQFLAEHGQPIRRMGQNREIFGLRSNGEEFPAEVGLAKFIGEDGVKVLSTIIDVTESTQITNELKRSNKELNDFAYVASHDLKAPLRGIMQLSSWVEEDVAEFASEETKNYLELLRSRTARLEKLLDDLLAYSRIGRHHGEVCEVDIKELVSSVFTLLDPPPAFTLDCSGKLPVLKTLAVPLEVIFRNLIGNAIKHHDRSDGVITISAEEQTDAYEFSVYNDGPGIAPKHQAQVFEMFKTLKPRDEVEGSGMGLAIIKKLLEYHGGEITVSSDNERGVCFTFKWPKIMSDEGVNSE